MTNSKTVISKLSRILAITGIIVLIIYLTPLIIGISGFRLTNREVNTLNLEAQTVTSRTLPPFNPALPTVNHIKIASIGVDSNIQEAVYNNYEDALKKGIWRVSDFGDPTEANMPTILAAHRFGYLAWTNTFRRKNSFYNLPKVKTGDVVAIYWRQREYIYEVYKTENTKEITDYKADLILYTCENLSGPERFFVYARYISSI